MGFTMSNEDDERSVDGLGFFPVDGTGPRNGLGYHDWKTEPDLCKYEFPAFSRMSASTLTTIGIGGASVEALNLPSSQEAATEYGYGNYL